MEVTYSVDQLKSGITKHIGDLSQGCFITLDMPYTTYNREITKPFLERARDEMLFPTLFGLNHYCYGRSFERKEKGLKAVSAVEIGRETQRLHFHLIILHASDTDRSFDDIRIRTTMLWRYVVPRAGLEFIDVKQFDPNRNWLNYITKGFTTFKLQYDFPSVSIH